MDKPTISFIVPTCGRPTLQRLISCLRDNIGDEDEVIVIGDGPQPLARGIMSLGDWRFQYFELAGGSHGNRQRDAGIARATKDFLMFADDDDNYPLHQDIFRDKVRPALATNPDRPHMFRIGETTGREIAITSVMGPQFVPPNKRDRLGKWAQEDKQQCICDFYFIRDTLSHYPEGAVYHDESIYLVRPQ